MNRVAMSSTTPPPTHSVRDLAEQLRGLDVLPGASRDELHHVASAARLVRTPARWALMTEASTADKAYLVLDGEVAVRRQHAHVAQLGAGALVGEIAVQRRTVRSATVVAASRLQSLHFTAEEFRRLTEEVPTLAETVQAAIEARLAQLALD